MVEDDMVVIKVGGMPVMRVPLDSAAAQDLLGEAAEDVEE